MRELPRYIEILRAQLDSRQRKNPRFSLRGFAAMLDIHPSALSRILSGKQQMSLSICRQVLKVLSLESDLHAAFVQSYADAKRDQLLLALNGSNAVSAPRPELAFPLSIETYENLVEVAQSPAWFATVDGRIFLGNRFLKELIDSPRGEHVGDLSFIHADDREAFENALERTRDAALASECEVRLTNRHGEALLFKVRIAPIRDSARNLTSWFVTAAESMNEARAESKARP